MKTAILHYDLENSEEIIRDIFIENGFSVDLVNVRETDFDSLKGYDLLINRVYSSVCFKDFSYLDFTLKLVKSLEESGVKCFNSSDAMVADYDKYDMYLKLSREGVFTPPTLFVASKDKIIEVGLEAINQFGFPLVVKRNCGGGGRDMKRVNSLEELEEFLLIKFDEAERDRYYGGYIIQKFIKSIRDFDCRVCIVNGNFSFSYKRNLIALDSTDKWVASVTSGSNMEPYEASEEEINLASRACLALGCFFSESDVIITEQGPCIIEVNLSPKYSPKDNEIDFNALRSLVYSISDFLTIKSTVK